MAGTFTADDGAALPESDVSIKSMIRNFTSNSDKRYFIPGYISQNIIPEEVKMIGTLVNVAGKENVILTTAKTGAEDFSYFQQKVPGFFFFLGEMAKGENILEAAPHYTPDYYSEKSGMVLGVRLLSQLAIDNLEMNVKEPF